MKSVLQQHRSLLGSVSKKPRNEATTYWDRFPGDLALTEFLKAHSKKTSTENIYYYSWVEFCKFTGLTGDQILASRREHNRLPEDNPQRVYWEKKVVEFRAHLDTNPDFKGRTPVSYVTGIRSFFSFNRTELKFIRTETDLLNEQTPFYEDYRFSRSDLKRMADVANLEEEYVIVAGKSLGLRVEDFMRLTRGKLEPYLDREPPIFIGEIVTQKEKAKAFPFIDSDAKPVIQKIIAHMDVEGRRNPNERILIYSDNIAPTRALRRVAERAGIKTGSQRVRFHCLRKFLSDHLSSHMSDSKWKQVVGKKIDERAYISPDSLREDYNRAMSETCWSINPEADFQKLARKEALRILANNAGYSDDDIKLMTRQKAAKSLDDEIQLLETLAEKKTKPDVDNYQQVTEDQLLGYLRQGWQVAYKLENGQVIIKKG